MDDIIRMVERILGQSIDQRIPISGGNICQVFRLSGMGGNWCLKTRNSAPSDFFATEQDGIRVLESSCTVRVPKVIAAGRSFILLEWLEPGAPRVEDMESLGRNLAGLHSVPVPYFGFHQNNYCGLTPQDNTPEANGHSFFANARLVTQTEQAYSSGLIDSHDRRSLERLAEKLPQWIPEQPPSLIHGDLWSGNILFSDSGPALIDPAAHHGWGEADLAMTHLFGSMDKRFYSAYDEVRHLEPGFRERIPLYNLYHLLNHLNLFGRGWLPDVRAVLERFT